MSETLKVSPYFKWGFSILCLVLISIHAFYPGIVIDSTTIGLLLLLLVPHVLHLLKKIGLPGGGEIEMKDIGKDIEQVKKEVETQSSIIDVGVVTELGPEIVKTSSVDAFYTVSDPTTSIAAFRIDLERKIRKLAELRDVDDKSFNVMLKALSSFGEFDQSVSWLIQNLYSLASRAIHGEKVTLDQATFIVENGEIVIKYLEKQIALLEMN